MGDVSRMRADYCERRLLSGTVELLILAMLWNDCTTYLSEICQRIQMLLGIQVSSSTICRIIHRNGLTRKKVQQVALQRSLEYRAVYMSEILLFDREMCVWVDETGCDNK